MSEIRVLNECAYCGEPCTDEYCCRPQFTKASAGMLEITDGDCGSSLCNIQESEMSEIRVDALEAAVREFNLTLPAWAPFKRWGDLTLQERDQCLTRAVEIMKAINVLKKWVEEEATTMNSEVIRLETNELERKETQRQLRDALKRLQVDDDPRMDAANDYFEHQKEPNANH